MSDEMSNPNMVALNGSPFHRITGTMQRLGKSPLAQKLFTVTSPLFGKHGKTQQVSLDTTLADGDNDVITVVFEMEDISTHFPDDKGPIVMKRVPVDHNTDLGTTIKTFYVNLVDRINKLTSDHGVMIGNVFYEEYREKFVLPLDRFGDGDPMDDRNKSFIFRLPDDSLVITIRNCFKSLHNFGPNEDILTTP